MTWPPPSVVLSAEVLWVEPDTLVMAGHVEVATVDWFTSFTQPDQLGQVAVVNLSAATFLHPAAVVLLLRCAQQVARQDPGRRLQVLGACPGVRASLTMKGLGEVVDLVDLHD